MKKLVVFLPLLCMSINAEDLHELDMELPNGVFIDDHVVSGNYLMYNCEEDHYACVSYKTFEDCKKLRKKAVDKNVANMPCAPLKRYETHQACQKAQYKYMYSKVPKKFCLRSEKGTN